MLSRSCARLDWLRQFSISVSALKTITVKAQQRVFLMALIKKINSTRIGNVKLKYNKFVAGVRRPNHMGLFLKLFSQLKQK